MVERARVEEQYSLQAYEQSEPIAYLESRQYSAETRGVNYCTALIMVVFIVSFRANLTTNTQSKLVISRCVYISVVLNYPLGRCNGVMYRIFFSN